MRKGSRAYGGADPELVEGDVFRIVIKVPEFGERKSSETQQVEAHDDTQLTGEVTGEVKKLLSVLSGEMKRKEMQQELGLKHEDHFRDQYLVPALHAGVIEMTQPDSPKSPTQKYRLTEKGKKAREQLK